MKYLLTLFSLVSATANYAQSLQDTSRHYNLFHPTPRAAMREFATDRPDVTESAYTLDAGHFQVETDLFKTERQSINGVKTTNNFYNVANIKLGITHTLDLQLVVGSLFTSHISEAFGEKKHTGFGGLTLRAKKSLWGNDNGKTALSILPFVNIPTSAADKFSGGVVFPFAMSLPCNWGFGGQLQSDIEPDESGNGYHLNYLSSATVSHKVAGNLDFFVEAVTTRDQEVKNFEYFANGGLIYNFSDNVNMDAGLYYGLKNTSSRTYFLGLSFRL